MGKISNKHPEEFFPLSLKYLIEQFDYFFQCQLYVNGNLAAEPSQPNSNTEGLFHINHSGPNIIKRGVPKYLFP